MNRLFAKSVSAILNPFVLLAVFPYILILKANGNSSEAFYWTVFSFIFLLVFSLLVLIGVEKGYFSDLDVSKRKERPLLYALAIALSVIYALFLYFLKAPEALFIALFGLIFGLICMEYVNRITKASVHVATISAFATALTLGYGPAFGLSFILVPLLAWARIKTHNHTKKQTLIGAGMGVFITLAVYVIFKYIV